MRILHLAAMLGSGGVERWLVDLCQEGAELGVQMDIATLHAADGLFSRRARELGIREIPCAGAGHPWLFVKSLRKIIRQHGPYDAVHCHVHMFSGFGVLAAWLEGVPNRVAHSHNVTNIDSSSWGRRAYAAVGRALITRLATAGIGPSADSTSDLFGPKWTEDTRWRVMRCGIRFDPFRNPNPQGVSRREIGVPENAFVLGSVGRLNPDKNPEFLLKVLEEVIRLDPSSHLVLVGEGVLHQRLLELVKEGGYVDRVHFLGVRDDIPALLRNVFDVFVLASPREALPLVIVEAQAAGLPIVMSDGVPEEAVVVPTLVRRLSLAEGPARWAEVIHRHASVRSEMPYGAALAQMEASQFSCKQNFAALLELYRATTH